MEQIVPRELQLSSLIVLMILTNIMIEMLNLPKKHGQMKQHEKIEVKKPVNIGPEFTEIIYIL